MIPFNFKTYKKNMLFVDIETIGDIKKGEKALPYDVSIKVINNATGKVLYQKAMLNSRYFYDKLAMNSAFYNNQDFYSEQLKSNDDYVVMKDYEITQELNRLIKDYKITTMVAYNCKFDRDGLDNLYELTPKVPNKVKKLVLVDLWEMAFNVCGHSQKYKDYCKVNKFITAKGTNYKSNAETVFRFLNQDNKFKEKHTGLCDLDIEHYIFKVLTKIQPKYQPNSLCGGFRFFKGCLLRTDN